MSRRNTLKRSSPLLETLPGGHVVHEACVGGGKCHWSSRLARNMSRTLRFDIHLNNALGIYHPGDMLSGHVTVLASEDIPVHGKDMHSSITYCHRHSSGHLLLNSFI